MSIFLADGKSYWLESSSGHEYPRLYEDVETDVVVVGAGIAGLTTAYLLKQSGLKVIVVEKDFIGAGVSGHTTGKITSQHNLIYAKLSDRLGVETARIYGEANQEAIAQIENIINKEKIDCDWRREDNYVYTAEESEVTNFKKEAKIAKSLNLPASFETTSSLPFNITGAVRFSNQATFHIRKYLLGLAKSIDGDNSRIYEHTRVNGIRDGSPGTVKAHGATIRAKDIVVTTNVPTFPLMARGGYCVLEYPTKSYIVAGKPKNELTGMYISPDEQHYSILPVIIGNDHLLLVGGESHIPGTRLNSNARFQKLAHYAQKHFGVDKIEYKWSHRDYLGYDDMPLIGRLYPWSKHVYTATGFMKWGLTNATVAGIIISDLIMDKDNPWASTFNSMRRSPIASIPKVMRERLG